MSKYVVQAGWDDVPHLSESQKAKLLDGIHPHMRDARTKGIPKLGAGAIYPIPEEDVVVQPFVIPKMWPRAYGFDVGWNRTAAIWAAIDNTSKNPTVYLYSEHYRGHAEPEVHAAAIKDRGPWIPGAIDPGAKISGQKDGEKLLELYQQQGLILRKADNAVESGIQAVYSLLSRGQLKVFSSLHNFLNEYRIYRRDEKGKIVKEHDHLMDALRYLIMTGLRVAKVQPEGAPSQFALDDLLGVDDDTGY